MRVIIFDLGGVYFTDGSKIFAEYLEKKYKIKKGEIIEQIQRSQAATNYRMGVIGREEFWESVMKKLGIKGNFEDLEKVYLSSYVPNKETVKTIRSLRKKYKVGYLSDNVKERADYLEKKFRFKEDFDFGFFSHDLGVRKPDTKIYKLVIEKLGVEPEDMIYIDDTKICIETAEKMSIKSILFECPEKLTQDLKKLGIELE